MRKLYFSNGSPFARKVRIVLEEKGLDYEKDINDAVRPIEEVADLNPCLQVPVLLDGGRRLFDSNLIVEYLLETYPNGGGGGPQPPLAPSMTRPESHWEDAKTLAVVEAMADSIVNLNLMKYSGATPDRFDYLQRQKARVDHCLDWLEARATPEGFWPGTLSVMDIALMCPLIYGEKRGVVAWRGRPNIEAIVDAMQARPSVLATPINDWPPKGSS